MQNEKYDPLSIEKKWQKNWEQGNKFQPIDSDENFSIVIPPPNVTGSLHMGHALEHSIIDVITRIKRLQGFQTLWLPGTDHAGICLLYTSPSPRDRQKSRMPSSA